jgi:hypothetical protein
LANFVVGVHVQTCKRESQQIHASIMPLVRVRLDAPSNPHGPQAFHSRSIVYDAHAGYSMASLSPFMLFCINATS